MTGRNSSPGAYGPGKAATLPLETLSHIMTFIKDQDDLFTLCKHAACSTPPVSSP